MQHDLTCKCDGRGIVPGPIGGRAVKCDGVMPAKVPDRPLQEDSVGRQQTDRLRRASQAARKAEHHWPADCLMEAAHTIDSLRASLETAESVIRAMDIGIAHPDMGGSHQARAGERPRLTPEQWHAVTKAVDAEFAYPSSP